MSPLLSCRAYHYAPDLPPEFWGALRKNEAAANIISPFAKKALDSPRETGTDQLWIILYDNAGEGVEFVLSCIKGALGNYPIFVFAPKSPAQLAQDESDGKNIASSLSQLVLCLLDEVPPQRVFSVFSVAYVAEKFAEALKAHGFQPHQDPYYDATFTFCTAETLNKSPASFAVSNPENTLIALRLADFSHLEEIKTCCKAFSYTSAPYILDDVRAEIEARELITNQQVWVHLVKEGNHDWETACLVATTRQSENVTAVTKVFTVDRWRGRGCAGRLLHRVCQDIFQKKNRVVLYVGNSEDLASARRVYHKVGFQGLSTQPEEKVENVERWLEIGFQGTTLGHW